MLEDFAKTPLALNAIQNNANKTLNKVTTARNGRENQNPFSANKKVKVLSQSHFPFNSMKRI